MKLPSPVTLGLLLTVGLLATPARTEPTSGATPWVNLFDPALSHWELWMGAPHQYVTGLPPGTPLSEDGHKGTPMGLGKDPKHVFTMIEQKGEPVLHITGEIFGGLTTLQEYENYHLKLEVKWGEKIWPPKIGKPRDSGLLFHCTGPHGAFWNVWMASLEFQIQENDMGDLYLLAGTSARSTAQPKDRFWSFQPDGESIGTGSRPDAKSAMIYRQTNYERAGDWNAAELYVIGDRAVFLVNGHVVNALTGASIKQGDQLVSLTRGKLQLQSEGAEVFYRRMQIRPISAIPAEILTQAGLPGGRP
jgi:hypothetical protein